MGRTTRSRSSSWTAGVSKGSSWAGPRPQNREIASRATSRQVEMKQVMSSTYRRGLGPDIVITRFSRSARVASRVTLLRPPPLAPKGDEIERHFDRLPFTPGSEKCLCFRKHGRIEPELLADFALHGAATADGFSFRTGGLSRCGCHHAVRCTDKFNVTSVLRP